MLFAEPERTAYDLNFRLFRFPVRVHPWFWLVTLIFGSNRFHPDHPGFILAWIAVVFVSILVHELGHALAFRAFGVGSHVVLHSFGGLAVPWDNLRGRGQRIVVALAGPAAGFLLAAAVWASNASAGWVRPEAGLLAIVTYHDLLYVNIAW
ncbi:MAG TPA: site-2 protease family protein, partial [Urbifossiella sp.]|nr:site-2 protease family protein [Urbifossiella sp.]